jgi:hypothetical protein
MRVFADRDLARDHTSLDETALRALRGPFIVLDDSDREVWLSLHPRGSVVRMDFSATEPFAVVARRALARALHLPALDAMPCALAALGARLARGSGEHQKPVVVLHSIGDGARRGSIGPEDSKTLLTLCDLARAGAFDLALSPADKAVRVHRIAEPFGNFLEPAADHAAAPSDADSGVQLSAQFAGASPVGGQQHASHATTPTANHAEPRSDLTLHTQALASANGPLALSALERLYLEHYLPLARAVDAGSGTKAAAVELARFRGNFSEVYAEVAKTLPLRQKRPKMLCDVLVQATMLARKHAARNVDCVLVDAMRFDIGQAFEAQLRKLLGAAAEFVDRSILWAALPTTTGRQLSLIAHGIDALRSDQFAEVEADVQRARTAATLRRIRVGNREITKLDWLEAQLPRLNAATFDANELGAAIAGTLHAAVTSHALVRAERTLLCVFGDHGFAVDAQGARQGGASPEEVFVPCYSWVVEPLN